MSDDWQYQCGRHEFSDMSEQLTFSFDGIDDVERQDMLSNYASPTYLQRWDQLQDKDCEEELGGQEQASMKVVISEGKLMGEVQQLLETTSDYDEMSLSSYNSVDDEKTDAMPNMMTDIIYCPYYLDIGRQISEGWRGYGDNIYFNPLNCQQLQILTGNQVKKQGHKSSGQKNSCRRKYIHQQQQENKHNSFPSTVHCSDITSVQHPVNSNLGSLRIHQTSRQRKCLMPFQQKLKGKICKGISKRFSFQASQRRVSDSAMSCVSKSKLLDYSASHKTVKSKNFRLTGRNTLPLVFPSEKLVSSTKEQILKSTTLPRIRDKVDKNNVPCISRSNSSKTESVQDPRPVLIIPFGTFDDPVVDQGSDNSSSSKKKQKQEYSNEKTNIVKDLNKTKGIVPREKETVESKNVQNNILVHWKTKCSKNKAKQAYSSVKSNIVNDVNQTKGTIPSEKETIENKNIQKKILDLQQTKSSKNKTEIENHCKHQENWNQELNKVIPINTQDKVMTATKKIKDLERTETVSPRLSCEESVWCPNSTLKTKKLFNVNKQNKAKTTPQVSTTTVSNKCHSSVRKILSNSSLSSYLSAACTYDTKCEQKDAIPKISYTNRMKPIDVQTTDQHEIIRRQSCTVTDQLDTKPSHAGTNVTFNGFFVGSSNINVKKEGQHFEAALRVQGKESNTGYSGSLLGFSKGDRDTLNCPQRGIRRSKSTMSGINVKFSIDNPIATNRKLMVNGREYQVLGNHN